MGLTLIRSAQYRALSERGHHRTLLEGQDLRNTHTHTYKQSLQNYGSYEDDSFIFYSVNWYESTYSRDERRTFQLFFPPTSKLTDVSQDV